MNHPTTTRLNSLPRKVAFMIIMAFLAFGAYATLGDGKVKGGGQRRSLLSEKSSTKQGTFSLKSNYSYRGTKLTSAKTDRETINMRTNFTYQKGRTSYTVNFKKKVLDNKITFNPNAATRN
jgi:hypothetical protein